MRWRTLAALVVGASLLASACGLRGEEQAQTVDNVQFDLLGTSTSTTSTTVPDRPNYRVNLFWHTAGDNRLRIVERPKDEPPSAAQTLSELVAGPIPEDLEINGDLQSRLDPSMEPRLFQLDGGIWQIQIQRSADEALTIEQAAEFVCTATQFTEIEAINIVDDNGVPFTLSGTGAVSIAGPAQSSDFGGCVEDPPLGEADADGDGDDPDGTSTTTA